MKNLDARINRLEKAEGMGEAKTYSVHFVDTPEKVRPGEPNAGPGLWGSGNGAWHVLKAPGQSESNALKAAGIDTAKDHVIIWSAVGAGFGEAE